jgi:hypothetical protein
METFPADLDLALQSAKVVLRVSEQFGFATGDDQPFDGLGKQELMVKRDVSTPVLQRKDDPDSQGKKSFAGKTPPKKVNRAGS